MKKIVFLLAFVSIGIFANASNGLIHIKPVTLVEPVKPINEIKLYEEVGYEFENLMNFFDETVCVTVTTYCPESPNGSGSTTCTKCASTVTSATILATACATFYEDFLCPAP
jgi:hypothetical protein